MTTATVKSTTTGATGSSLPTESVIGRILKLIGMALLDVFALILVYSFAYDGSTGLAIVVALITVFANVVFFVPSLYPIRWMAPGFMLVMLLVVYPIFYTVTTAFTNYSNVGHPLPKNQSIQQIIRVGGTISDEDTRPYNWLQTYEGADGTLALWVVDPTSGETLLVPQGQAPIVVEGASEPLPEYQGFTLLERRPRGIQDITFGTEEDVFSVASTRSVNRGGVSPRYTYDETADTIIDQTNGQVYVANDTEGYFQAQNGSQTLQPGYRVFIGLGNFSRLINDPALRGPLVDIFVWTVVFAFLSVLTTFALGLIMSMILNDPIIPARKVIRSILLIPYAIPGVISIVVWRGMFNQNLGIINNVLGENINWLNDPSNAKFAIILVNLWLGYPYMMLICSGALQSIPSEVYEAASVDGANPWQKFWQITLPLLLVAMGPLLIGSFVFNFNNYLLITALTQGNPPINGSPIPGVGYTDILISYVYKSAFSNQADYGYASAITIVIFFLVAAITLIQYRFTRTWEQVGENV
jgi:arabinogalactan oligomer / maltooligosaccharide transport system permease protein